jgi:hypothetical protein
VQEPHKMMQLRNIDRKEQNPYNRNNPWYLLYLIELCTSLPCWICSSRFKMIGPCDLLSGLSMFLLILTFILRWGHAEACISLFWCLKG